MSKETEMPSDGFLCFIFILGMLAGWVLTFGYKTWYETNHFIVACNSQKYFVEDYQVYSCEPTGKWVNKF